MLVPCSVCRARSTSQTLRSVRLLNGTLSLQLKPSIRSLLKLLQKEGLWSSLCPFKLATTTTKAVCLRLNLHAFGAKCVFLGNMTFLRTVQLCCLLKRKIHYFIYFIFQHPQMNAFALLASLGAISPFQDLINEKTEFTLDLLQEELLTEVISQNEKLLSLWVLPIQILTCPSYFLSLHVDLPNYIRLLAPEATKKLLDLALGSWEQYAQEEEVGMKYNPPSYYDVRPLKIYPFWYFLKVCLFVFRSAVREHRAHQWLCAGQAFFEQVVRSVRPTATPVHSASTELLQDSVHLHQKS